MDREDRIAELQRKLDALTRQDDGEGVQVVERPLAESDADRIGALERKLEEVAVTRDARPAIQVIQRVETNTDAGKKKRQPTPGEEKAQQVVAWGCAVAMVLWAAWCFGATAAVVP